MKTLKKSLVTILATIMLLTFGFTAFGARNENLKASAYDYEKIYYFYDYYPSVDYSQMENTDIVYDFHELDENSFSDLIEQSYFDNYLDATKVVIDIKTFRPSSYDLYTIFRYLHDNLGCMTVFVTPYAIAEFANDGTSYGADLTQMYVDSYYQTDFEKLDFFVNTALKKMAISQLEEGVDEENATQIKDTCILLDGRKLIGFDDSVCDVAELAERNPLLKVLANNLQHKYAYTYGVNEINYLINVCFNEPNIHFLIYKGNDRFVELATNDEFTASDVETMHEEYDFDFNYIYALGFWELSTPFYNFLLTNQGNEFESLPVYVMEVEPINYSANGLLILSDTAARNGSESRESATLRPMINDLAHFNY